MKRSEHESQDQGTETPRHPIQVVSRRTGLSSDVIRVWERRYGAVKPARAGGRRIYSDADIRRLSLLQQVTDAGRRISDVAGLDDDLLKQLAEEDRQGAALLQESAAGGNRVEALVEDALQATRSLDPERLRQVISAAATELSQTHLLEQMLVPFLRQIGDAWKLGTLRVGQEHLASAVVRQFLMTLLNRSNQSGSSILFTTPPGHRHELGVLMAAITAESEGWSALYLGPETPAEELAAAAVQADARAVALGLQSGGDESRLMPELSRLRALLPEKTELILSGRYARQHRAPLEGLPARLPETLAEFRELLSETEFGVAG
ncbi:MAG: MerR family transcriptional regulator [Sedimenticola sp.]|nr:MerR family transcriptional regulator [Sedimenticola sp.]